MNTKFTLPPAIHCSFKAETQDDYSTYRSDVICSQDVDDKVRMAILVAGKAVYIIKQQAMDFFGLVDPKEVK